jgi:hypothetical protein
MFIPCLGELLHGATEATEATTVATGAATTATTTTTVVLAIERITEFLTGYSSEGTGDAKSGNSEGIS